jgi:tight adherence protein C
MTTYQYYRDGLIALLWLTVSGTLFWVSLRPSRPNTRLGLRGLKRQQSLLRPLWSTVEPFVRWMGVRVGPFLSDARRKEYDALLTHAGDYLGMTAEEYFGCTVTMVLFGGGIGWLVSNVTNARMGAVAILFGAGVFGIIPFTIVDTARVDRFKAINRGLPSAIDLMALCMSAGLDFPGSVQQVVEKAKANEALREELGYLLQQLQLGRTRIQALRELANRVPVEVVREFVQALIQAEERGNPVSSVLEIQAGTARARRTNQAEKAASDMKSKMVLPTMIVLGVMMMIISYPSNAMLERMSSGHFGRTQK